MKIIFDHLKWLFKDYYLSISPPYYPIRVHIVRQCWLNWMLRVCVLFVTSPHPSIPVFLAIQLPLPVLQFSVLFLLSTLRRVRLQNFDSVNMRDEATKRKETRRRGTADEMSVQRNKVTNAHTLSGRHTEQLNSAAAAAAAASSIKIWQTFSHTLETSSNNKKPLAI